MAAQNNDIRTNYIKAWIDNKQNKKKMHAMQRLRKKTVNHEIMECSKLAQM